MSRTIVGLTVSRRPAILRVDQNNKIDEQGFHEVPEFLPEEIPPFWFLFASSRPFSCSVVAQLFHRDRMLVSMLCL